LSQSDCGVIAAGGLAPSNHAPSYSQQSSHFLLPHPSRPRPVRFFLVVETRFYSGGGGAWRGGDKSLEPSGVRVNRARWHRHKISAILSQRQLHTSSKRVWCNQQILMHLLFTPNMRPCILCSPTPTSCTPARSSGSAGTVIGRSAPQPISSAFTPMVSVPSSDTSRQSVYVLVSLPATPRCKENCAVENALAKTAGLCAPSSCQGNMR
jgi:hypothetical protein